MIVLPADVWQIIAIYVIPMPYKLIDWLEDEKINIFEKIDWNLLYFNDRALEFLKQNTNRILIEMTKRFDVDDNPCQQLNDMISHLSYKSLESFDEIIRNQLDWSWYDLSSNPDNARFFRVYPSKIIWHGFCSNTSPDAIQLISENLDKIHWRVLSANPAAAGILAAHQENIDWNEICRNTSPDAVQLISENMDRIENWTALSANPAAVGILLEHQENIVWAALCRNTSPAAIELLQANLPNVDWTIISGNESATSEILECGLIQLSWNHISDNRGIITFIESHLDRVKFSTLSTNPAAMHILKKYPNRIDWGYLSENPSMFEPDLQLYHQRVLDLQK